MDESVSDDLAEELALVEALRSRGCRRVVRHLAQLSPTGRDAVARMIEPI